MSTPVTAAKPPSTRALPLCEEAQATSGPAPPSGLTSLQGIAPNPALATQHRAAVWPQSIVDLGNKRHQERLRRQRNRESARHDAPAEHPPDTAWPRAPRSARMCVLMSEIRREEAPLPRRWPQTHKQRHDNQKRPSSQRPRRACGERGSTNMPKPETYTNNGVVLPRNAPQNPRRQRINYVMCPRNKPPTRGVQEKWRHRPCRLHCPRYHQPPRHSRNMVPHPKATAKTWKTQGLKQSMKTSFD